MQLTSFGPTYSQLNSDNDDLIIKKVLKIFQTKEYLF